ncbi:MAG: YfhO family protein [Oscillospiraceae bacterium]|nr:YfhO family protein [Oscillospiraceae bacterium]
MKLPQMKNKKWNYLAWSFFLPLIGLLIMLWSGKYIPFGETKTMLYSDMWHQYYPFFVNFRSVLRSGNSLLYNWNIGTGLDYLGLIAYYLGSPLNLLSALLPESWVLPYFELLMPLKLSLASLFFAIFLKKTFGRDDLSLPLFGCFYALCAWALNYHWNIMWLDTFALLPLVILGMIKLLRERKFILYTVTLALSVAINYYIGFFTCIFVLLCFICYQICRCKSLKRLGMDFVLMGVFTVLAIGMTAVITLPALSALQSTYSSVNSFPDYFNLNIADYWKTQDAKAAWDAYKAAKEAHQGGLGELWMAAWKLSWPLIWGAAKQVAGNMSGGLELSIVAADALPNIYCGVGTVMLAFLFLTSKQVKIREKLCCVFMVLFLICSFIFRQLDYIWHGFHFTNMIPYRFSFLYSFMMLYMAYRAFILWRYFKPWKVLLAGGISIYLFMKLGDLKDPTFLAYNALFIVLYLLILLYAVLDMKKPKGNRELREFARERKQRRQYASVGLAVVMVLEIAMNLTNFITKFPYTDIATYPKEDEKVQNVIKYMKQDDELFYRTEVTHSQSLNDGALNGYSGITTFTSSANVSVTNFMKYMGQAAQDNYNRYCYEESSPVVNLFLNLKYMIERDGKVEENRYFDIKYRNDSVYLLENQAYLPLGFLAENQLADLEFYEASNNFVFQNELFRAATGLQKDVWHILPDSSMTLGKGDVNVTQTGANGYVYYDNGNLNGASGKWLSYTYTSSYDGLVCLDMDFSARNQFYVYYNGEHLYEETLGLPQTLAVCDVEAGDTITVWVWCKPNERGSLYLNVGVLDDAVFQEGYDILNASTLELTSFKDTKVEGTINCNRDGLLYTSIPQNGNWHVYVDGEEAEVQLVGEAMVGVYLTEGEHQITFRYRNKSYTAGLIVTIICTLAFWGIAAYVHYPDYKPTLDKWKAAYDLKQRQKANAKRKAQRKKK